MHPPIKKCTTTQKTKARFSHILRHPAWKQRGPILISALHKFVTYLLTAPGPTQVNRTM